MSVFWAVCCLLLAAGNDFLFKIFNRKQRSEGLFVALIGIIWLVMLLLGKNTFAPDFASTIFWGSVSGFLSIVANLLLIDAMKFQSAGVSSTIYRLNLVGVTVGACLIFHEKLSVLQFAGTVVSLAAIGAFFPWMENSSENANVRLLRRGVILALTAACLRAIMGLCYKYSLMKGIPVSGFLMVNSFWWILGGVAYYLIFEIRKKNLVNLSLVKYGLASGVLVCGICGSMAFALETGKASIVLPIAQMSFIPTFLMGAFFLKEKITAFKVSGALLGLAGILMLTI